MPQQPDFFRDFGIIPFGVSQPSESVRSYLPWWHVFGQFFATGIMTSMGLGIGVLFAFTLWFPVDLLAACVALAGIGYIVYFGTRHDYLWVELDGTTLRAKHLYTHRVVERPLEEVEDLLTLVFLVRIPATVTAETWLGRVRGIEIRFRDHRTPLRICRADPAMTNARELIDAIVYNMSQVGEVDAEIIDFAGKPFIRRIYWE